MSNPPDKSEEELRPVAGEARPGDESHSDSPIIPQKSTSTPPDEGHAEILIQQTLWAGPVPHPDVLRDYHDIDASFSERIVALAERQAAHRQSLEVKRWDASIEDARRDRDEKRLGQISGLVLGAGCLVTSGVLGAQGHALAAGAVGSTALMAIVGIFVLRRWSSSRTSQETTSSNDGTASKDLSQGSRSSNRGTPTLDDP